MIIKCIVVTLGADGTLAEFAETQRFVLFERKQAQWRETESCERDGRMDDAQAIRRTASWLASRFESCRIILSRKVSGIAYQTLGKSGYSIFEADDVSGGLLDDIIKDVLASRAEPDLVPMEPQSPLGDGHYFFDLARLQKAYPEITSKRALMGFMTGDDFLSLELVCDHLPPWMDEVLSARGYNYKRKSEGGDVAKYTIVKNDATAHCRDVRTGC